MKVALEVAEQVVDVFNGRPARGAVNATALPAELLARPVRTSSFATSSVGFSPSYTPRARATRRSRTRASLWTTPTAARGVAARVARTH
ncbi:MAG: hypothetical protein WKH64_10275 [Chloroflexia bacterium]